MRSDDARLAPVTFGIGVSDLLRREHQRDKLATEKLVIGVYRTADADVRNFAGQPGLSELRQGYVDCPLSAFRGKQAVESDRGIAGDARAAQHAFAYSNCASISARLRTNSRSSDAARQSESG